jgi:hypothetical protein
MRNPSTHLPSHEGPSAGRVSLSLSARRAGSRAALETSSLERPSRKRSVKIDRCSSERLVSTVSSFAPRIPLAHHLLGEPARERGADLLGLVVHEAKVRLGRDEPPLHAAALVPGDVPRHVEGPGAPLHRGIEALAIPDQPHPDVLEQVGDARFVSHSTAPEPGVQRFEVAPVKHVQACLAILPGEPDPEFLIGCGRGRGTGRTCVGRALRHLESMTARFEGFSPDHGLPRRVAVAQLRPASTSPRGLTRLPCGSVPWGCRAETHCAAPKDGREQRHREPELDPGTAPRELEPGSGGCSRSRSFQAPGDIGACPTGTKLNARKNLDRHGYSQTGLKSRDSCSRSVHTELQFGHLKGAAAAGFA